MVALEAAPAGEKDGIEKLVSAIFTQNNHRTLMAHSRFEPAKDEAVQFKRTVATDGKVKVLDPLWTKSDFEKASAKLKEIEAKLSTLKSRPMAEISPEWRSQMFHYLYTSAQRWVPSGDE